MSWCITDFTQLMNVRLPIIQAPMAGGATTPELVAAVSNAGGLGSLGAGYMAPAAITQAIRRIRQLTLEPFAVNVFIPGVFQATRVALENAHAVISAACSELNIAIHLPSVPYIPAFEGQMAAILAERPPILSFTFGVLPSDWIVRLKANGIRLMGTATTLTEAKALVENGVDGIVAQGREAGGHRGTWLYPAEAALPIGSDLVSRLVTVIQKPIIAAGGIMTGSAIATALRNGAAAVQMGTAFLTCPEAGVSPTYQRILLQQTEDRTVLTRTFSGKLARGIRNLFIDRLANYPESILDYPIQHAFTKAMRQHAQLQQKTDFMSLWAGQSVALCRALPAAELMAALVAEVEKEWGSIG